MLNIKNPTLVVGVPATQRGVNAKKTLSAIADLVSQGKTFRIQTVKDGEIHVSSVKRNPRFCGRIVFQPAELEAGK